MVSRLQKLPSFLSGSLCFLTLAWTLDLLAVYSVASVCRDLEISENVCDLEILDFRSEFLVFGVGVSPIDSYFCGDGVGGCSDLIFVSSSFFLLRRCCRGGDLLLWVNNSVSMY